MNPTLPLVPCYGEYVQTFLPYSVVDCKVKIINLNRLWNNDIVLSWIFRHWGRLKTTSADGIISKFKTFSLFFFNLMYDLFGTIESAYCLWHLSLRSWMRWEIRLLSCIDNNQFEIILQWNSCIQCQHKFIDISVITLLVRCLHKSGFQYSNFLDWSLANYY